MKTCGFHIGRFGLFFFAENYARYNRNYARYNQIYTPAVVVEFGDYCKYIDVELKILCFGFGIRFYW